MPFEILKKIAKCAPPINKLVTERNGFALECQELQSKLYGMQTAGLKQVKILSNENTQLKNLIRESDIINETHIKQIEYNNNQINLLNNQIQMFEETINQMQSHELELKLQHIELVNQCIALHDEITQQQHTISTLELTLNSINSDNETRITFNSGQFWENHYANGGNSGTGSYSHLALFKAEIINSIIKKYGLTSIIEFGCGDGNQLSLGNYPNYVGVDVSSTIIKINREKYILDHSKQFYTVFDKNTYMQTTYNLCLSLDVIFHLLEEESYLNYMHDLFQASNSYVLIYSSNHEEFTRWPEYRHRKFTKYIQEHLLEEWELVEYIPNKFPYIIGQEEETSAADFFLYKKR